MVTVKKKAQLVIPSSVQQQAGLKTGDRLEFRVKPRSITITAVSQRSYRPTTAEWAAIRQGDAAIARGDSVSLSEFLDGLSGQRRKIGAKASRKVAR